MDDLFAGKPPSLDLSPRAGILAPEEVRARIAATPLPAPRRKLLLGLALLWHDDWRGAHAVAQEHEGRADFDLLHAIGHRREGDFGNSDYWFSSAGRHPCFEGVARALESGFPGDPLLERLLPGGEWNPSAFVALVKASKKNTDSAEKLLRVQALEMRAFADWVLSA